jgi:hypothetical protein
MGQLNQKLCTYRDIAIGSSAVPLSIRSKGLSQMKSSRYFDGDGIGIDLHLDSDGSILEISLGSDLRVNLETMKNGIEVSPLGLFPAHVLQLVGLENFGTVSAQQTNSFRGFDASEGGTLRFGYLNRFFTLSTIAATVRYVSKGIAARIRSLVTGTEATSTLDLCAHWSEVYGKKLWKTFDVSVQRDNSGKWVVLAVPQKSESFVTRCELVPVRELIAEFNVNAKGIALGIATMQAR